MAIKITALAGGTGGAKLVDGLATLLEPDKLTLIVNTGDDFEHLGLAISPDLDTVTYTLAGLANPQSGWGRTDETWNFLQTLKEFGSPVWFRLGDRDLALHVERTRRMKAGQPLSEITRMLCRTFGIDHVILPMTDDPVRTIVETEDGDLPFQEYFVKHSHEPQVRGFRFEGIENAMPAPGFLQAIEDSDAVILCPSNPWVSIDPILALSGVRKVLEGEITVGVSPIIGGQAVRGPAAKMFTAMGIEPSACAVAEHYRQILSGILIDEVDAELAPEIEALGIRTKVTQTMMRTQPDRKTLAEEVLTFTEELVEAESRR
ncbi:MAG: 2-phospho-L-lactate transferase [Anaerolineales bacterium]|nr:MAG: 2-phospho-L-lactate transferase [Anaerolineales bacterium]